MLQAFKAQPPALYDMKKSLFRTHPLVQVPQLYQHLNSMQRKKAALYLYYMIAGMCLKESIIPCKPDDPFDLADRVLTGDPDCSFSCGKKKTKAGFPKLPPTLQLLTVTVASKWYPLISSPDQVILYTRLGQSLTPDPEVGKPLNHFTLFHMDLIVRHAIQLAMAGIRNMTDSEISSTFASGAAVILANLEGTRKQKEQGGVS